MISLNAYRVDGHKTIGIKIFPIFVQTSDFLSVLFFAKSVQTSKHTLD